jgi:hypothetical protein
MFQIIVVELQWDFRFVMKYDGPLLSKSIEFHVNRGYIGSMWNQINFLDKV